MATTSSTTKAKTDNQNLTRTKSLGRKPKLPSSTGSSEDGSDQKPEKPLPNYLKPTISSRPDPVKLLKKNNSSLDDNQKLLRRRSFDRPPSSLTSPSTSASPRIQKSLNVSPSRSRDRPAFPREKPVTAQRSSSFHGSRGVPRGGTTVKSPPVAPKKSGLSSSSTSSKSKREGSENVTNKKASDKEINALDSASMSSAQEDHQEEILKVESDHVQVADHNIEEPKDEKQDKEVQETVVQANESVEEKTKSGEPTPVASPIGKDCNAVIKELEEKMINNEEEIEEKIEETKEQDNNQDNKGEEEEDVKKKIDENETPEKVDIESKNVESVEETTQEKEEEEEKEKVKEEEKEKVKEDGKEKVEEEKEKEKVKDEEKEKVKEEESGEGKKKEVVKGKKESPSAYNDVIASKMQENPRKNKVLALAGAFQTVIDYETAASK
ncbi:unnamed protein product [Arabidopsis lyrata]|uniref:Calmodulin-binding domain-containing protein n=1 Tax=Arabidopsis lyrata subsp. lyrata TaxID=81972 RepID=D7M3S8_ARALL|nr:ABC transporter F family member 4 [Arabidopsis lyrata subsp. lyrata]EFH48391.1 hypothetical protein ARALYDRAFT_489351 [Arabidopsis lyrata subsp. lyrata]CAH8272157.1 unnamed protein product [Arabidopsis lyrata]|eukprot:XP_002872132.1 ABC transporter F family member 4 [Arabidopsis lyrata subsp. lyrata]